MSSNEYAFVQLNSTQLTSHPKFTLNP